MPFTERPTSKQDWSEDANGYVHLTRTFRVWGVDPDAFWNVIDQILEGSAPSRNTRMPLPGDVQKVHRTLPVFSGGEGNATETKVTLMAYRIRPVGPVAFDAIAEYTNDPRSAPLGQALSISQHRSFVPIPYAKRVPVLPISGTSISVIDIVTGYVNAIQPVPMVVEQVAHTVSVPRGALTQTVQSILTHANELHTLPMMAIPALMDGGDIRLRSPDWLDVTYRWQYQQGILAHSPTATQLRYSYGGDGNAWSQDNATENSVKVFPGKILPLLPELGSTKMLLPAYHTIEMLYKQIPGASKTPVWEYACTAKGGGLGNWRRMPGAQNFIW